MTVNHEIFATARICRTTFGWVVLVLMEAFIPGTGQDQIDFTKFFIKLASQKSIQQEQLQRLAEHAANPTELHVDTTRISSTVRHETVKRGSHPEELEASEYVIAGVFKSTANARHFSNGLRNLNFNSRVGYLTEKDLWYVYIFRSADAQQAAAEQKRVGKLFLLRDAWRLTVVE